jgi:hypothetical protein
MSENELTDEETPLAPEASEEEDESPDVEGHIKFHHSLVPEAGGHVAGAEGHVR